MEETAEYYLQKWVQLWKKAYISYKRDWERSLIPISWQDIPQCSRFDYDKTELRGQRQEEKAVEVWDCTSAQ